MTITMWKRPSKPPKMKRNETEKQRNARQKNWHILQLHGAYGAIGSIGYQCPEIPQEHILAVKLGIDQILKDMGCETIGQQRERRWKELEMTDPKIKDGDH